jgi:hypothetical protein
VVDGQGLRWKVKSKAPHAHLYEYGTLKRYTRGTGAHRGKMDPTPTFVPSAQRWRARMVDDLIALLKRQTVPGMSGQMDVQQR